MARKPRSTPIPPNWTPLGPRRRTPRAPAPSSPPLSQDDARAAPSLIRAALSGPDGTVEGDAWALLGVRVLVIGGGHARGDYSRRHRNLAQWLSRLRRDERERLARDTWAALWGADDRERQHAKDQLLGVLDLTGTISSLAWQPSVKRPRGSPLARVCQRVRAAADFIALDTRKELLGRQYLDLLPRPAGVPGPGRGHKKTT